MTVIDVSARPHHGPSWSMVCTACCLGFAGALLFAAFPQIDLFVSRLFYVGDNRFLFSKPGTANVVREMVKVAFVLVTLGAVIGFIAIGFASRRPLGLSFAAWIYILLTIGVGAGLVANLIFKEQWARARPMQIVEFGGAKQFTTPLTRSNQCAKNCSFVSGEASSIFAAGFAIALLADRARRRRMMIAAIVAGGFAGLLRVGAGAHFLSDVFFAGIFMAITARLLYWLVFERFYAFFADEGPLHRRTLHAGRRGAERARRLRARATALRRRQAKVP